MRIGPKYKICRRLGNGVFEKCETPKFQLAKARKMGTRGKFGRKSKTEFGTQLLEKQKVRFSYFITERQLSNYVGEARKDVGHSTGRLYEFLERRLDNVVYRAGFVPTRIFARQVVSHGHIEVNGKRITIPSYSVRVGDVITIRKGSKENGIFKNLNERLADRSCPNWLSREGDVITVTGVPSLDTQNEFTLDFGTVIEFYTRV